MLRAAPFVGGARLARQTKLHLEIVSFKKRGQKYYSTDKLNSCQQSESTNSEFGVRQHTSIRFNAEKRFVILAQVSSKAN